MTARDVDPKSVRVVLKTPTVSSFCSSFPEEAKEAVKKVAVENYGNKVFVRDLQGQVIEGGISLGTSVGMSLQYKSKDEAEHVAGILRGENFK